MKQQVTYRNGDGVIVTEYNTVTYPRTAQPRKYRDVTVSMMDSTALTAWRVSALNADILRTETEREMVKRAQLIARQTARATESIWAYTEDSEDANA